MERQVDANDMIKAGTPPLGGTTPPPEPPPGRASTADLITALIVAIAFGAVLKYLDFSSFLMVLLGLSFVIFIHEFGHFIVAKMCDVHVTHFSIGFGPVIPGCWFKWGETTYQICLLPLGGYVQMVGQVDGDEASDGSENDPRSYRNKSVGARMAIISAGVIMNVILAFVIFIVVYRGPGKERIAAVIGEVEPGGPAFVYGLRTGMNIERIGDIEKPYFDDLKQIVTGSSAGEVIEIVARRDVDLKPSTIMLEARKSKTDANPILGVAPAFAAQFKARREVPKEYSYPVLPGTAAERAEPKFDLGDAIVATTDPKEMKVVDLPEDPLQPGQKDFFEFMRRMQTLADKPVIIRVKRGGSGELVDITVPAAYQKSIGAVMKMGHIVAIRKGSPAEEAKIQLPEPVEAGKKFLNGDLIEKVEVIDADGKPLVFEKETLDPERLPSQLKAWAQKLVAAGKMDPAPTVSLTVKRHRDKGGDEFAQVKLDLKWDNGWAFDRTTPFTLNAPAAIPELGIAYQIRTTVDHASEASKLKAGDVIKGYRVTYLEAPEKETTSNWTEDLKPENWAFVGLSDLQGVTVVKLELKVDRDKQMVTVEVTPENDVSWPRTHRGWALTTDSRVQKAVTILDAISLGLRDTGRSMKAILNGIRQMIRGRIDIFKHLGGPLSIMRIAYSVAGHDFWEFVFFLGLISINLAVINFLPIPLLDGGHMVFLIYEKIRGKPASEGVRIAATYVGLAFIACLILLVTYLDIFRWF